MINKKNTGSYYTPKILSDFLTKHIIQNYLNESDISILEPSCGDGEFVSSFFNYLNLEKVHNVSIDLFDINKNELDKAEALIPISSTINKCAYHQDYLKYFLENDNEYSLILGNPPYVKRKNLKKVQLESCDKVHEIFGDSNKLITTSGKINNIWIAFVEAAIMSLSQNGILCFVIPSEVMQVKYAKEMRALIINEFDRVEVFAFNELIFEGIQQDVIVLLGIKGIDNIDEHGFSFYQVDELEDLKEPRFTEKHSNIHRTTLDKWTNYILADDDLNFIDGYRNIYNSIKSYTSKAQVGIVSAANDYFLLNDEKLKENGLNRLSGIVKPILPKGDVVPNVICFNDNDFSQLKTSNKSVNFLHFPDKIKSKFGKIANAYFSKGEEKKEDNKGELHLRYKMLKRENWYHVPSVWSSQGLFIKRSHLYPKMFVNQANVLATDSFYRVDCKEDYCINRLVFSFYNSLTFVLAELEGRFYGGGVLELIPTEFKSLRIPYNENISNEQLKVLDEMFRNNTEIKDILEFTNPLLIPDLDTQRLETIRAKLVNRRIKNRFEEVTEIEPIENEAKMNILVSEPA